jgi:hypothetical protein
MTSPTRIGFDRTIRRSWLDAVAALVLEGRAERETRTAMDEMLTPDIPGAAAKKKTLAILSGLWIRPTGATRPLRDAALPFYPRLMPRERLAVHWGLAAAAFPFFFEFVQQAGRLLRLQEEFASSQVIRRLRERFGDREVVERAAYHVLASLGEWHVVTPAEQRGVFSAPRPISIESPELAGWMVEATLTAAEVRLTSFQAITQSVALFPFALPGEGRIQAHASSRLEFSRQGLTEEMVSLLK